MRLKCPVCGAQNEFDEHEPLVCRHCGFSSDSIEEPPVPESAHAAVTAPTYSEEAPTAPHLQPGTGWDPTPTPTDGEQGAPVARQYPPQATGRDERPVDPFSVAAMVTGIVGIVTIGTFPILLPLAAVVLSIIGITRTGDQDPQRGRGFAVTGLILGIIALVLGFFWLLFMMFFGFHMMGPGPWWFWAY